MAELVPLDARILDVGCAQGHLLAALHRVGYRNLTGIDVSTELIRSARRLVPNTVILEHVDLRDFPGADIGPKFDLIFFHDVLEHLPREQCIGVLQKLHELLLPGGRLNVRVPNMSCLLSTYCSHIDFTHLTNFTSFPCSRCLKRQDFTRGAFNS